MFPLNSREHYDFISKTLEARPSKVIRTLQRKITDGELDYGEVVHSSIGMVQRVGKESGSIGYISDDIAIFASDNIEVLGIK